MHPVEIATDTLVGHGRVEDVLAVYRHTVPFAKVQHVRAWLRYLTRKEKKMKRKEEERRRERES